MWRKFVFLFLGVMVTGFAPVWAQTQGCEVPKGMTKDQKLPCVRTASILLDQPTLTPEQLSNGPDFDSANPDQSRFAYFTGNDTISCYFRPHYAFVAVPGDSMKFQCWHMTPDGAFYSKKGEPIRVDEVKVVIEKDKSGERSASLYARNDDKNEHEIKADRFKIKYLKPPYPDHNPRFNEVFTTLAASRIMWVLGFPADHVYPAAAASCIGCGNDPFGNKLTDNKASLKDAPTVFKIVSAERELPWDEINPEDDETWSWTDAAKFYSDGEWSHKQKVEFDAYRLALGLIHYHNALPQQNRVDCAEWAQTEEGKPKVCSKPVIYVHDLGSTFGKKRSGFDLFGTNPRGSFDAWRPQTVFVNPGNCELRATLLGDKQVLKEAQDLMIQRVARLDRDTVKSIFRVSRFNMMDQKQVRRLRSSGTQNVDEAALDEWTVVFMKRIDEIRTASNCKAN
ncbi:MAG TPA: hypothetical protein VMG82_34055 [Candidatus Sulfotelmatobacter sp.]|nr:hypothetical protein [Candidatus Sulfotelmatobacter sp.]